MNEHIKLLKEQAMEWVPNMADPDTKIRLLNAEKFAELIIRECAGLMDGRRVEYGNCKDGRVILKHFGVEP
jgi:hypothetical protein